MPRKSPTESATLFKVGTRKKGNDGNMWEVKTTKTGVKRWTKVHDFDKEKYHMKLYKKIYPWWYKLSIGNTFVIYKDNKYKMLNTKKQLKRGENMRICLKD